MTNRKNFKVKKMDKRNMSMYLAYGRLFPGPKDAKYAAVDMGGRVKLFNSKPSIWGTLWYERAEEHLVAGYPVGKVLFEGDWRKSVVRLEKVNINAVFRNNCIELRFWD